MKIELCEDNASMTPDKKPTLVVLVITNPDGLVYRIPYHADKTIQQLYEDARKIVAPENVGCNSFPAPLAKEESSLAIELSRVDNKDIARNDKVRCVDTVKNFDGEDLEGRIIEVGKIYRVLNINKENGNLVSYELIDDNADAKHKIPAFPSEIELVEKFVRRGMGKVNVPEITSKCKKCGEVMALRKEGKVYRGKCDECGRAQEEVLEKSNV